MRNRKLLKQNFRGIMKRLLFCGLLTLGLARLACGQASPEFLWNGVLSFGDVLPQVDATIFINEGIFDVGGIHTWSP